MKGTKRMLAFAAAAAVLLLSLLACAPKLPEDVIAIAPNTPDPGLVPAVTRDPERPIAPFPAAYYPIPAVREVLSELPSDLPSEGPFEWPEAQASYEPLFTPEPGPVQDESRIIYLTFDDGPCEYTHQVLDILDRFGAKATFFTVGYFVDRYPEYAAEIMQRGSLIACHTYSHDFTKCYKSADAFVSEVHQWERAVRNACGHLPARVCVRFPGGSKTRPAQPIRQRLFSLLRSNGYRWFDWNSGNNDKWPEGNTGHLPNREYLMDSYRESIGWFDKKPGSHVIFLSHDTEPDTVAMLPDMLRDLVNRGYVFRTLDQHPDWNN